MSAVVLQFRTKYQPPTEQCRETTEAGPEESRDDAGDVDDVEEPPEQRLPRRRQAPRVVGTTQKVTRALVKSIRSVVGRPDVGRFYIGLTSDLPGRRACHGADRIAALYVTSNERMGLRMAAALAADSKSRYPTSANVATDLYGQVERAPYFVYVAIWTKRNTGPRSAEVPAQSETALVSSETAAAVAASPVAAPPVAVPEDDRARLVGASGTSP